MDFIKIEEVLETVVHSSELNCYYKVQIGKEVETRVPVENFEIHQNLYQVWGYCAQMMEPKKASYMYRRLETDNYLQYNGEHHFPIEVSLALDNGANDRYKNINEMAELLEEVYQDKFKINIKLKAKLAHSERGITVTVDWGKVNEAEKSKLEKRGYGYDAFANTDLLVKELNCHIELIHCLLDGLF